jgi:hypothetical protein
LTQAININFATCNYAVHYEKQQQDKLSYLNDRIQEAKLIAISKTDEKNDNKEFRIKKLVKLHEKVDE